MADPPLHLGFEEAPTPFEGPTQRARIWTEHWVRHRLFCPSCGAENLSQFPGNRPVADFYCPACNEEFELKSKKHVSDLESPTAPLERCAGAWTRPTIRASSL